MDSPVCYLLLIKNLLLHAINDLVHSMAQIPDIQTCKRFARHDNRRDQARCGIFRIILAVNSVRGPHGRRNEIQAKQPHRPAWSLRPREKIIINLIRID